MTNLLVELGRECYYGNAPNAIRSHLIMSTSVIIYVSYHLAGFEMF